MRPILSEKNLVVVLFILVVVIFSFAQEDSKKMSNIYAAPPVVSKASLLGDLSANTMKLQTAEFEN
jgi:hypothetical protein